jgi:hypothetical protein
MCLIIKVPKGQTVAEDIIESAIWHNSDGFGYMVGGKSEKWRKGKLDHVMAILDKYCDNDLVLHFRMATDGAVNKRLAHPFKMSNKFQVMHNGIFSKYRVKGQPKDKSDTTRFVSEFLEPMLAANGKLVPAEIEKEITGNKLAIMDTRGNVELYGGTWTDHGGCLYSNTYAWDYPYSYGSYSKYGTHNAALYGAMAGEEYQKTYADTLTKSDLHDSMIDKLWSTAHLLPVEDQSLVMYEDLPMHDRLLAGEMDIYSYLESLSSDSILELYTEAVRINLL